MVKQFIINDIMVFTPSENKLSPLGVRGPEIFLNVPVSRLLSLLLQHPGTIVPQDIILHEVWGKNGQMVALNTLYQNVSLLRKSLIKAGDLRSSVRTHSKIGFSFRGDVKSLEPGNTATSESTTASISVTEEKDEDRDKKDGKHLVSSHDAVLVSEGSSQQLSPNTQHKKIKLTTIISFGFFFF